ncbi:MAG: RNA pyrophosphohydrolase [Candidatus Nucleicultricaceae bacterium]
MIRSAHDYRPGVGIVLLNTLNHVLIGQRFEGSSEAWQMPQGGIDSGETPIEAAFRELEEEVGTRKAEVIFEVDDWLYYDIPPDIRARLWGGKFIGQRQKWFAMRFLGTDSDINIKTAHPEFRSWKWSKANVIPEVAIEFRQESYQCLFEILRSNKIIP